MHVSSVLYIELQASVEQMEQPLTYIGCWISTERQKCEFSAVPSELYKYTDTLFGMVEDKNYN